MLVYLDTSALSKLVVPEAESAGLREFLSITTDRVSSELTRLELLRAVARQPDGGRLYSARAQQVLEQLALIGMTHTILERAAAVPPPDLRSLDAIHLATMLSLPELSGVLTYDRRLGEAAANTGLRVWTPGRA